MLLRIAERFGLNPYKLEEDRTEDELSLMAAYERLRMAEEEREQSSLLKMLAAGAGVKL